MVMVEDKSIDHFDTKEVVSRMLRENTGRSLLDSGGTPTYDEDGNYKGSKHGYGRMHEINSQKDFDKEPPAWMDVYVSESFIDEIIIYGSLYHFLVNSLQFSHVKTARFNEFAERMPKESWGDVIMEFIESQHDIVCDGASGMYTYNFDFPCNQDIVVWQIDVGGEQVIILRSHNGCDARGGFSSPSLFTPTGDSFVSRVMTLHESIHCSKCHQVYDNQGLEFVDSESNFGDKALEGLNVFPSAIDNIKECLCKAMEIELNPVRQLSLEQEIIYPTPREAMEEAMEIEFGEVGDKVLYHEDYDELGSYLQCPSCKKGRLLPSVGILV